MTGRFETKHLLMILLCCVVIICPNHAAADRKNLEADLRRSLENHVLSLRNPDFGHRLRFDSAGNLLGNPDSGPWSMCGLLQVDKLVLKPDHVEMEGNRVLLILRSASKDNLQIPNPAKSPEVTTLITDERIRISVAIPILDADKANEVLSRVFEGGQLPARVAGYWQPGTTDLTAFRKDNPNGVVGYLEGNRPVYIASGGLEPPKLTHSTEPAYTESARQDKVQGTAVLSVVVNERGYPEILEITPRLGEGLDIQAFAAVAEWKFKPATKDGQPVAVLITVQVNFRLY